MCFTLCNGALPDQGLVEVPEWAACDEAHGSPVPSLNSLRFGEFGQYVSMAALGRAPAAEDLPFQFGLHGCQQRRMAENIRAVFLDDLLAIAVAADHEGIPPLREAGQYRCRTVRVCSARLSWFECLS